MTRIVDLSAPIAPSAPGAPVFQRTEVAYDDHAAGATEVQEMFGVPPRLLRDGSPQHRKILRENAARFGQLNRQRRIENIR